MTTTLATRYPNAVFPRYWSKQVLSDKSRMLVQYHDDAQIPICGCVCCSSLDSIIFSSGKSRYSPRNRKAQVFGIGVAEAAYSWLINRIAQRAVSLIDPPLEKLMEMRSNGALLLLKYPPYWLLHDYLRRNEELDPMMQFVPVQVHITRKTAMARGPAVTGLSWNRDMVPDGFAPLPPDVKDTDYVISARDLRMGLHRLMAWLIVGDKLDEAHQELACVAAKWLYPRPLDGARTGYTIVQSLARRLHHPCAEHAPIVAGVFGFTSPAALMPQGRKGRTSGHSR